MIYTESDIFNYVTARFYNLNTGIFTGNGMSADKATVLAAIPEGCGVYYLINNEEKPDYLSKKVDILDTISEEDDPETWRPNLIDYQPEPPANNEIYTWEWNTVSKRWDSLPTLQTIKRLKWLNIKSIRDSVEFGEFTWDGSVFDGDVDSQRRIIGKALKAKLALDSDTAFEQPWKLADNTFRVLSAQDMIDVGNALDAQISSAHETAAGLWVALEAATTKEEVEAIVWP